MNVRPLKQDDRGRWEVLWKEYQAFYHADLSTEMTELTWSRFHDPGEPMHALGVWSDSQLAGIVHYIFHRSCWTAGPYCYLQDLYVDPELRGRGLGCALIEAVYRAAAVEGASRVYWLTHETNNQAMLLYDRVAERTGFVQYRHLL